MYCMKGYTCFQPSMNSLFLFINSFLEIHFCLLTVLSPLWNDHRNLYWWSSSFSPFISEFDVTMNGTCMIIAVWEGEIPMNCFCVCGVELHFLPPFSLCSARDVGADRSGWKMWSLLPSSSFYSSSPTTSLKIAGRKRRQWSRGSISWAASGFNTPTTSTREKESSESHL